MNVAVLGYGTIGSGVVEIFDLNKEVIKSRVGQEVKVKYVLDIREFPGSSIEDKLVHDFSIIESDADVRLVVETMGGVNPAYTFVKKCLEAGKHVTTSNKELVAKHGAELIKIAREKNVNFLFGASVGGGIPIIRPLNEALTGDIIQEITGILNGTTNYILDKMENEGWSFAQALKDAQDKGYAEKHPEADIEGYDTCRKIAILTSLSYGKQVDFEDIYTEGITKITAEDIKYAKAMGRKIKLLGMSKKVDNDIYAMVCPMMLPTSHPLGGVNGVFNAVFLNGNMVDNLMFYGRGAGKLPTASAVVADVIQEARNMEHNLENIVWSEEKLELTPVSDFERRFFIRLPKTVTKEEAAIVFGEIEQVHVDGIDEFAFITSKVKEQVIEQKLAQFETVINRIRLAD